MVTIVDEHLMIPSHLPRFGVKLGGICSQREQALSWRRMMGMSTEVVGQRTSLSG